MNGPLSFASPNFDNSYNLLGSIDWNLSDKDQIRGRYINNKTTGIDTYAALPVFYGPAPVLNNFGSISEFHNFSPSMENEFRVSFSRHNAVVTPGNFAFPGLNSFPNIAIDELGSLQIGPDPNAPGGGIQNLLQTQLSLPLARFLPQCLRIWKPEVYFQFAIPLLDSRGVSRVTIHAPNCQTKLFAVRSRGTGQGSTVLVGRFASDLNSLGI